MSDPEFNLIHILQPKTCDTENYPTFLCGISEIGSKLPTQ